MQVPLFISNTNKTKTYTKATKHDNKLSPHCIQCIMVVFVNIFPTKQKYDEVTDLLILVIESMVMTTIDIIRCIHIQIN